MSKTNKENQQPDVYDELLKNGTAVLRAKTREELAELVNNIPAEAKYMAGAVGRSKDDGTYSIKVDIIKN
jgi:hypothetical protein